MKIISLNFSPPVPSSGAGSPRVFEKFRYLKSHGHETILALLNGEPHPHSAEAFNGFRIAPKRPKETTWINRRIHSLLGRTHCDERIRRREYFHAVQGWIEQLIESENPDCLHVRSLEASLFVPEGLKIPTVVDFGDSLELLYKRKAAISKNIIEKLRLRREARALGMLNAQVAKRQALSLFISPVDKSYLTKRAPNLWIEVVPNGVDSDYFEYSKKKREEKLIIFFGVLNYAPNRDAAQYLCNELLPEIRAKGENPKILIVGKSPNQALLDLAVPGEIEVLGEVEDIRPYLNKAALFVCPLRFGAGVKNKVLVAMCSGLPVVASSLAVEGIHLVPELDLHVADGTQALAEKTVKMLRDPAGRLKLAERARNSVEKKYSWSSVGSNFEKLLGAVTQMKRSGLSGTSDLQQLQEQVGARKLG